MLGLVRVVKKEAREIETIFITAFDLTSDQIVHACSQMTFSEL